MSSIASSNKSSSPSPVLTIQCAVRCWRARKALKALREECDPTSLLQENLFRSLHRRFRPSDIVAMIRGNDNFVFEMPPFLQNTLEKVVQEHDCSSMPTFFNTYSTESICHTIKMFVTVLNNDELFPRLVEFRNLASICSVWSKSYSTVVLNDRKYTHSHCLVEDIATSFRPNGTQIQERAS